LNEEMEVILEAVKKGGNIMQVWFVMSLFFSLVVAGFAVQNSDIVTIRFYLFEYQLSESLVILISAALGAIIAIFLGLFSKVKSGLKIRELNNTIKNSEQNRIELNKSKINE